MKKSIGRVHWLLIHLPKSFKSAYKLRYDYVYHKYCFWRHKGYRLLDCFIVIRTSKKCFRVVYFNYEYNIIEYLSLKTSVAVAIEMYNLYLRYDTS